MAELQYAHALICIVRLLHVFKIKVEVQLITVSKHSDADRKLFTRITGKRQHSTPAVSAPPPPSKRKHQHTLHQRSQNFQLPDRTLSSKIQKLRDFL